MKILFAVDGSECALAALEALVARLDWFRERPTLHLIHVHAEVPYPGAKAWAGEDTVQRYYDEETDAALNPARDALMARGVAHELVRLVGDPANEIARHAEAEGYDLIVLGTKGRTALSDLVLGSVASKVTASTQVPVLLLK